MSNAHAMSSPLDNGANATVAANIRGYLAYLDITQGRLARHLGLGEMAMSRRMKSGTEFTSNEIAAIAEFFDVTPGDLFAKKDLQITER